MLDVCRMYADCSQMYVEVTPIELLLKFCKTSLNFQSTLWSTMYRPPPTGHLSDGSQLKLKQEMETIGGLGKV